MTTTHPRAEGRPAIAPDPDADVPERGEQGPSAPDAVPDPDEYADPDAPDRAESAAGT
jgi:hypothetical protein